MRRFFRKHFSFARKEHKMLSFEEWADSPVNISSRVRREDIINVSTVPEKAKLSDVIDRSRNFPIEFPVESAKCENLKSVVGEDVLERNVNSAYPLVHEKTLVLYHDFLEFKREHGSDKEKKLYERMTVIDLVDRLLRKRAICFVGSSDGWKLRNGKEGYGEWETIGKSKEKDCMTLDDYLSYDEIKLSALLSISSYTYFVNDGNRRNMGRAEKDRSRVEDEGIIVGLIGTRLHKMMAMEYQEIVIEPEQNVVKRGYGAGSDPSMMATIAEFYAKPNYEFDEFLKDPRSVDKKLFKNMVKAYYLDIGTYKKRLLLSLDLFFVEANTRAKEAEKFAYVHVVGIGLGVWMINSFQIEIFMETVAQRLESLGSSLHSISDVDLAYIQHPMCGKYQSGDLIPISGHPNGGIRVHISKRQPHAKLVGEHEGKLAVVSYAWDGNAFPGNEYWFGSLNSSSDPAAACSTQVTELHNAYINEENVRGVNLHVATKDGVKRIDKYLEEVYSWL